MYEVQVKQVEFKDPILEGKFNDWVKKQLTTSIEDLKGLNDKRAKWIKQYEGKMEPEDSPAAWQTVIDVPLSRELIQAATARLVNPVTEVDKIMSSKPRKPDYDGFSRAIEDYLDYAYDQFDFQEFAEQSAEIAAVQGMTPVKLGWYRETVKTKDWVYGPVPINDPETGQPIINPMTGQPIVGPEQWQELEQEHEVCKGAIPKIINPSDFLYPTTSSAPEYCQWMGDQFYLDEYQIKNRIRSGDWRDVFSKLSASNDIDAVTKVKEELGGIEPTEDRYQFVEMYITKDIDGDGVDEEIITTVHWPSGIIVRNIYNYLHHFRKPYIIFFWRRRPNSMESFSACHTLEDLHRAYSAIIRMSLDSGALAAKGWQLLTTDQGLVEFWKGKKFQLGGCTRVTQLPKDSSEVITFGQPQTNILSLAALIREHAQLAMSINLYNMGQEQTQRPTASGQTLLVEEGKQPLKSQLQRFREFISMIGIVMLYRAKQFSQNEVEYFKTNDTGQVFQQFLQFPAGLIEDKVLVEPTATTATMNEQVRRQEIVALYERMLSGYNQIIALLTTSEQLAQQGSPNAMVVAAFAEGANRMLARLLDEFKVPKKDEVLPPIDGMQQAAQEYTVVIQQLQQQLQQLQMMIQQMMQKAEEYEKEQGSAQPRAKTFGSDALSATGGGGEQPV